MSADGRNSPLGRVPPEWSIARLQAITTKIGSGATPRGGESAYLRFRHRFALIRSQNVFDHYFSPTGLAFLSDQQAAELDNAQVQQADVLLNITGDGATFARSCSIPPSYLPACVNQHVAIIRVDPRKANPGYVAAYLSLPAVKPYMESFNSGGSRRAITKGHIESFEIPLPPLREQEAIGAIAAALDDKIDLNRRMNQTLEAISRAIFKSWFVDFDPVRVKVEGRHSHGLARDVAALFPKSFAHSILGMIPQGWTAARLKDHIEAIRGLSYKGEGLSDSGRPLHNLNSVYEGGGYKNEGMKYYKGDYKDRHIVHAGDVIVTNTEQGHKFLLIGCPAIVPQRFGETGLFSHHLYRVRPLPHSRVRTHFLYELLLTPLVREQVVGCTNGTTVNMLSLDGLEMPEFVLPPAALIDEFECIAAPLYECRELNYDQSRTLANLRDTLLPNLLSGEIRVKEAENAVGAAI